MRWMSISLSRKCPLAQHCPGLLRSQLARFVCEIQKLLEEAGVKSWRQFTGFEVDDIKLPADAKPSVKIFLRMAVKACKDLDGKLQVRGSAIVASACLSQASWRSTKPRMWQQSFEEKLLRALYQQRTTV